jgi:myo-inositol-1(or 4)-monophosphatase
MPIRPSHCRRLDAALVVASLPANIPRGAIEIAEFIEVLHEAQSVRRLGSAALNLCYYWAGSVKAWDVAAGAILLEEAGAVLTSLTGDAFRLAEPHLLSASTPQLHRELQAVLARIGRGPHGPAGAAVRGK